MNQKESVKKAYEWLSPKLSIIERASLDHIYDVAISALSTPQPKASDMERAIEILAGLYYCGRTWTARQHGTMHERDLCPADEDNGVFSNVETIIDILSADERRKERERITEKILNSSCQLSTGVFTLTYTKEALQGILGETPP